MKKTQLKDALRNIWKQKISFLSIAVIAALGVTMFLGINYSAAAIKRNASAYYNGKNYRDIELISTLLISEKDLDAIRNTEGVVDVEGIFYTSAKVTNGGSSKDASVISATSRIGLPDVLEGRMPETLGECAVEKRLAESMGWNIGDRISLENAKGGTAEYLTLREHVITGMVIHPDHICTSVPEPLYVIVPAEAFFSEYLDGCFMRAEIVADKPADSIRFNKDYRAAADAVLDRIESQADGRTAQREADARAHAQGLIDKGRLKLDEAKAQLEDGERQLAEGRAAFEDGEKKLADAEKQLADARKELDDAKAQLETGKAELDEAKAQLDEAKAQLEEARAQLDEAEAQLAQGKEELENGWRTLEGIKAVIRNAIRSSVESAYGGDTSGIIHWAKILRPNVDSAAATAMEFRITDEIKLDLNVSINEIIRRFIYSELMPEEVLHAAFENLGGTGEYDANRARELLYSYAIRIAGEYLGSYNALVSACRQWDEGHAKYLSGREQYLEGLAQYEEGLAQYEDGEAQYLDGLGKYNEALEAYNDGEEKYAKGLEDLASGREELEANRLKLEEGERELEKGRAAYEDGEKQLADAIASLEQLGPCKWILLDVFGNASFVQLGASAGNLEGLETTFSLLFVVVGALVIYATISKMIDEQKNLVGTTKALGFFNREIFRKYLFFGVSAVLLGAVAGMLAAYLAIESFVLKSYNIYFTLNITQSAITFLPTAAVFLTSVLLAAAAIWFACSRLLKMPAVKLMQQAAPEGKKTSGSGRRALSLYSRLILLNMKTDIKRVLVTIVSVAGCCSLVVIGFTLRNGVARAIEHQYEDVVLYDGMVSFDLEADGAARENVKEVLDESGAEYCFVTNTVVTVRIKELEAEDLYCGSIEEMGDFIKLCDVKTGEPLEPSNDGLYIGKRFAEVYGLKAGDRIELTVNGTSTAGVTVVGIFNNYMNRYMFMSRECFDSMYGFTPRYNAALVRFGGTDRDAAIEKLGSVKGFVKYTPSDEYRPLFKSATQVLDALVALFIFMAAVMAGVVLMNLTNIYIMQKKRELTIMRVNGFTVGETIGYVLRETVVTTALGIILGIALGSLLGYSITRALEQPNIQFHRGVCITAWLIGAALTLLFTAIVNFIALRKVKKLKLTDAA